MPARSRHTRGFTLLEAMTVVAIIGILAALAGTMFIYGPNRARMNNAAFELAAALSTGQLRATSRGIPYFAIFYDEPGGRAGLYLVERADPNGPPFNWATADISNELATITTAQNIREHISLTAGTRDSDYADLDSPILRPRPLPAPFQAIPLARSGADRMLQACSFCVTGPGGIRGVIRFSPDGTIRMETGASAAGGVFGLRPSADDQQTAQFRLIVISAPAGAIRVF